MSKFKKGSFYIHVCERMGGENNFKARKVNGYLFAIEQLTANPGSKPENYPTTIEFGMHKDGGSWIITHIDSGMACNFSQPTREKCVEWAQENFDVIAKCVMRKDYPELVHKFAVLITEAVVAEQAQKIAEEETQAAQANKDIDLLAVDLDDLIELDLSPEVEAMIAGLK